MFPGLFSVFPSEKRSRNVKNDSRCSFRLEQDKQCMSNITLRHVRATIVAVEKQGLLRG
jgi:hypothetical protein